MKKYPTPDWEMLRTAFARACSGGESCKGIACSECIYGSMIEPKDAEDEQRADEVREELKELFTLLNKLTMGDK